MWYLKKIPKILHLYWGNEKLSFLRFISITSFLNYNPDWEIRLYVPTVLGEPPTWKSHEYQQEYIGINYFDCLKILPIDIIEVDFRGFQLDNYLPEVHKSDFLRWHVLQTAGGVYADTDILYFYSLEYLSFNTKENQDMDSCFCLNEKWADPHSIGFLMARPDREIFHDLKNNCFEKYDPKNYQGWGSAILNKAYPTWSTFQKSFPGQVLFNLPMDVFYSYGEDVLAMYNGSKKTYYTDRSLGLHWYGGHPRTREFENLFSPENMDSFSGAINFAVQKAVQRRYF